MRQLSSFIASSRAWARARSICTHGTSIIAPAVARTSVVRHHVGDLVPEPVREAADGGEPDALVVELGRDQLPPGVDVADDVALRDAHVVVVRGGGRVRRPTVTIGVHLNPADAVGTTMIEMPLCFGASGSVRHASQT